MTATLQQVAATAGLIGLVLLFLCGSPFPGRTRGAGALVTEQEDEGVKRKERLLDVGSWAGFLLSLAAAALQLASYRSAG